MIYTDPRACINSGAFLICNHHHHINLSENAAFQIVVLTEILARPTNKN